VIQKSVDFISAEDYKTVVDRHAKEIEALHNQISLLHDMLAAERNKQYVRKSEKLSPGDLLPFADIENASDPQPEVPVTTTHVAAHERKRKGHGRTGFPGHLPRKVVALDLPEEDRWCPDCGSALNHFGEEECERGHIVPVQVTVIKYVKQKYACPNGHCVKTPATPNSLLDRCKYEPSVYAHLAVSKYQDHLPLHQLEGIYKRNGLHLPRSTMWEMLARLSEIVILPVIKQMRLELLLEPILHADNTGVKVRLEDKKGMREGQIWTWLSANEKKVLHDFTTSKGNDGPLEFLKSWTGKLIVDAAPNFNMVVKANGIVRVGCWAHAVREVKHALKLKDKNAVRIIVLHKRLSHMETCINARAERKGLSLEEALSLRSIVRKRTGRRIVDAIVNESRNLLRKHEVLPKSPLGTGAKYILKQEMTLRAFLEDPRLPQTNNAAERALRPVAVGRKNWLFFGSTKGGKVASAMYSIMLSCRAIDVNPEAYLTYISEAIARTPATQIATLTPWAYAEAMRRP
jgi:transposase